MSRIIDEFHGLISPIVPGGKANWRLMIVHTLTLLAMLRLDTSWNSTRSVETALSVISLLNHIHPEELKPINPMIGFLWYGVGQVLVDESHRLGEASGSSLSLDGNETKITEAINLLCYYMEECGHDCPYIGEWLLLNAHPPTLNSPMRPFLANQRYSIDALKPDAREYLRARSVPDLRRLSNFVNVETLVTT